jgi:PPM family protein phosphatase
MNQKIISIYGKSHIGNHRRENQDRVLYKKIGQDHLLLAIADGMGGEAAGGLASDIAICNMERIETHIPSRPEDLSALLHDAGDRIIDITTQNEALMGMGTTLTTVLAMNSTAIWAHVGDSRLYHLSRGNLRQITRDHNFVWELIESGEISWEEALKHPLRHVLDQCLGTPDMEPDWGSFKLEKGDMLILTTDGLHACVSFELMHSVLDSSLDFEEMAEILINKALDNGSRDNLSIVIARV